MKNTPAPKPMTSSLKLGMSGDIVSRAIPTLTRSTYAII